MPIAPKMLGPLLLSFVVLGGYATGAYAQANGQRNGALTAISPVVMPTLQSGTGVLYDQTNDAIPPLGASAQQLYASPGAFDTQAADDIVISDPLGWSVSQISFVIATDNGKLPPATAATVNIVADRNGLPNDSTLLCQASNVVPGFNAAGNVMSVAFSGCKLPAGHYWIEMQAVSNFNVNGNFVWEARSVQSNNAAVWRNPGNAFPGGPPCPGWAKFDACQIAANQVGHEVAPDLLFQVQGAVIAADTPPPALPMLSTFAIWLLIGLIALLAARPAVARR